MGASFSKVCCTCREKPSVIEVTEAARETCEPGVEANSSSVAPLLDASQDVQEITESDSSTKLVITASSISPTQREDKVEDNEDYLNFVIFTNKDTVDYIQKSKLMVILKGLPGSGKSHIADKIEQVYEDSVVCSADQYFIQDGEYKFDQGKLKAAHESCQLKAREAAEEGHHVIVIDNTNVKKWESKPYLKLAKEHSYTPLILEPKTPWAMDPKQLALKNSHGVSEEILQRKVKMYDAVLPTYYWWYLNEVDSLKVITIAREWMRKALQVQEFYQVFSQLTNLSSVEDILSFHGKSAHSADCKVLHATAKVAYGGKQESSMEYIKNPVVRDSMGKLFHLHIIGFVVTPRTFGARLKLGETELELWGMDDEEVEKESDEQVQQPENGSAETESNKHFDCTKAVHNNDHETVSVVPLELRSDRFYPTCGKGSRAHLTLGCAPGVHAHTTGFDLIRVVACEQKEKENCSADDSDRVKVETYSIPEGSLRRYEEGLWVIYPEKEVVVGSLFSAYY